MKLIVQIPCFNEEQGIAITIADIPRSIPGVDQVEVLVIDDGSHDRTVDRARNAGADHIVTIAENKGLANAFRVGLEHGLKLGADVMVNTDADNQYQGRYIPALIQPILANQADIVIGSRNIEAIADFSWLKKKLQRLGSAAIRLISRTYIEDAPSGFRAYSRDAALSQVLFSTFSYTLESIIASAEKGLRLVNVPIETNPKMRESRLFSSIPRYIYQSLLTVARVVLIYWPLRIFLACSLLFFLSGSVFLLRYAYFFFERLGKGHVQSVIVGSSLMVIAIFFLLFGLIAELLATNRKLLEEILLRIRREALNRGKGQDHNDPLC
jgi:glycosyltransferase involved in cell wall biosynthesis